MFMSVRIGVLKGLLGTALRRLSHFGFADEGMVGIALSQKYVSVTRQLSNRQYQDVRERIDKR